MPRFYFHLSAPDQDFPDNIGSDVSDLTAAHSIAVRLMKRVMMFSSFADCAPDLRLMKDDDQFSPCYSQHILSQEDGSLFWSAVPARCSDVSTR